MRISKENKTLGLVILASAGMGAGTVGTTIAAIADHEPVQINGRKIIDCAKDPRSVVRSSEELNPGGKPLELGGAKNLLGFYSPDVQIRSTESGALSVIAELPNEQNNLSGQGDLELPELDLTISDGNTIGFFNHGVEYSAAPRFNPSGKTVIIDLTVSCPIPRIT